MFSIQSQQKTFQFYSTIDVGLIKLTQPTGLDSINDITKRGFTGHEHIDHANVIHMNGRIYDPTIGRFMQADPIIQEVKNSQNYNRYSYVLNNPLSYTDPTGYRFRRNTGTCSDFSNACTTGSRSDSTFTGQASSSFNGDSGNQQKLKSAEDGSKGTSQTNASDQFDNPTDEINYYQKKYGAVYRGPKDDGTVGTFEIDNTNTDLVESKVRVDKEDVYTGSLEGTIVDPYSVGPLDKLPNNYNRTGFLVGVNENIVDVHTITRDVMDVQSLRTGSIGSFDINFRTGQVIESSRRIHIVNETKSSGVIYRLRGVSTRTGIIKATLPRRVRRVNYLDIKALRGKVNYE